MRIGDEHYLIWCKPTNQSKPSVSLIPSVHLAFPNWSSNTRVSPVFDLLLDDRRVVQRSAFIGDSELFFFGPVNPVELGDAPLKGCQAWLSFGLFNIIVKAPPNSRDLRLWIEKMPRMRYERWRLRDSVVLDVKCFPGRPTSLSKLNSDLDLQRLVKHDWPAALQGGIQEFVCLAATCIARCAEALPQHLAEFSNLARRMSNLLGDQHYSTAVKLQILTDVNAGLSRFGSQCFSGASPISETECHYWTHSLLGTGMANLALLHIRTFLQRQLGEAQVTRCVANLRQFPALSSRLFNQELNAEDWNRKFLPEVAPSKISSDPFPLIPYFSGRDSFRTTETTLSAPLGAIHSCSEDRWTLHTISHEVSHTIVHAALARMLRDDDEQAALKWAVGACLGTVQPENLLEEARCFLYRTMAEMESATHTIAASSGDERIGKTTIRNASDLWSLCEDWLPELEELLVHAFDFLYFHAASPENYVQSIWKSWGVLPTITPRVPDYLTRTIVAISLCYDGHDGQILASSKKHLDRIFKGMLSRKGGREEHGHINAAHRILKRFTSEDEEKYLVRLPLARFVKGFLFSDTLATACASELHAISQRSSGGRGYPHKALEFSSAPLTNPLQFIKRYTDNRGSPAKSVWLLHQLALNFQSNET